MTWLKRYFLNFLAFLEKIITIKGRVYKIIKKEKNIKNKKNSANRIWINTANHNLR